MKLGKTKQGSNNPLTRNQFNKAIRFIFEQTATDQDLILAATNIWLHNFLNDEQTTLLDQLKLDAWMGDASCPERYLQKAGY